MWNCCRDVDLIISGVNVLASRGSGPSFGDESCVASTSSHPASQVSWLYIYACAQLSLPLDAHQIDNPLWSLITYLSLPLCLLCPSPDLYASAERCRWSPVQLPAHPTLNLTKSPRRPNSHPYVFVLQAAWWASPHNCTYTWSCYPIEKKLRSFNSRCKPSLGARD